MKVLKIYGVKSLMEWQCVIPSGGARFHFAFTDGVLTSHGTTPARYRTADPLLQNVIERSQYFKSGKIFLEKKIVLEQDEPKPEQNASQDNSMTNVEVACLDDAKDYLNEHFGVEYSKMSSSKKIKTLAAAFKVNFVGLE